MMEDVETRIPSGEDISISFKNDERGDPNMFEAEIDMGDEYVGSVQVDYWPQRKRALVYLASIRPRFQGKKIGTIVYPIVDKEVQRRWHIRLSSDKDEDRSEAATGLWKSFEKKGMAKREGDHYVMTGDK